MMGPTHRLTGALAGAAYASASGYSWPVIAMTALVATATSHGWASPDVDQTSPWRAVAGVSGPLAPVLAHRRLSHWWALPAAAWWLAGSLPADARWPAYALLVGWISHLLGDFIFGKLPAFPWGGRWQFGLGLTTGGWVEKGPATAVITLALLYVLWATPSLTTLTSPILGALR